MPPRSRRGFGQITKMRSGRYQARYIGPDTALHTAGKTFDAKIDAEGWLSSERRLITDDTWTPPKTRGQYTKLRTFGSFAEDWLLARTLKPRTRDHYRRLLDRVILPTFAEIPIKHITPDTVRTWHTRLGDDTPTLRAHSYSLLRAVLHDAVADEIITVNPCHIRGAGNAKRKHKIKPATLPELTELVAAMPERHKVMTLLAAWCGLRFGELAALRRSDLDLANGVIHIRRGVVRAAGETIEGPPKTDAGIRDVVIPPHLIPAIREHLAANVNGRQGLLFPAADGVGFLQPSSLYGKAPSKRHPAGWGFYGARAAAGRPDLRWHDLRHTGAVLAASTGATLAELMSRLGHSTAGAAMRYQHAAQDRDRVIAGLLSELATRP
ncbi:site-specific integrase [Nakamurella sp. A5-74]|uniref:Site-specific integrase n=1 Tax=Nakamurella sp. A5-74 TaxID=3158264 RepID=A0AAU8DJT1_9ACTN